MKKATLIGFLALASAMLGAAWAQPKLVVVGGNEVDFGKADRGVVAEKKLTLKNTGTQTLIIGKIETTCGCTGTLLSEDKIAPGKTGELKITFDTKNYSSGPAHKNVIVNSNSADDQRTVIGINVTVVEEVVASPFQLWLREGKVGKVDTMKFTIKNEGTEPFTLTGYNSTFTDVMLALPKDPIEPGKSVELSAIFTPKAAKVALADNIFIQTTNKKQPEVRIAVFGSVKEFKFE